MRRSTSWRRVVDANLYRSCGVTLSKAVIRFGGFCGQGGNHSEKNPGFALADGNFSYMPAPQAIREVGVQSED